MILRLPTYTRTDTHFPFTSLYRSEEAEGYNRLIAKYDHPQEDIARAVSKSRSHVANTLRLLNLPPEVRTLLEDGQLTAGHARALLGHEQAAALEIGRAHV